VKAPTDDSLKARIARAAAPGFSYCLRCGMPWNRVKNHTTWYAGSPDRPASSGCFPLCEDCWLLLGSPEARIEYYGALIDEWEALGAPVEPEVRAAIGRAVANEDRP
jgi:hypothetical protein